MPLYFEFLLENHHLNPGQPPLQIPALKTTLNKHSAYVLRADDRLMHCPEDAEC
jgi:hypothetical protein